MVEAAALAAAEAALFRSFLRAWWFFNSYHALLISVFSVRKNNNNFASLYLSLNLRYHSQAGKKWSADREAEGARLLSE